MEGSWKRFRSHGKLMLSGEYLVLHGALSLAVPTIPGQSLTIKEKEGAQALLWKTRAVSKTWLECSIDPASWQVLGADRRDRTGMLVRVLKAASEIRGDTEWLKGKEAVSEIEFDVDWGLGSSSSLISNIAWWAGIDPFHLARMVSGGSGYDIACARSDKPLLYWTGPAGSGYTPVEFHPTFHEHLAFVYLGKKQDSAASVRNFLSHARVSDQDISRISAISEKLCRAGRLEEFEEGIREHETVLSGILGKPPVKTGLFNDYQGEVKSLGAWGGDFVMITMHQALEPVKAYFAAKGMATVIPYGDMVKL